MTPDQRTRRIVHNAATHALNSHNQRVPLTTRIAITEAVLAALAEHGLLIADRDDLTETVKDAAAFDQLYLGGDDATGARLNRLRAALHQDTP